MKAERNLLAFSHPPAYDGDITDYAAGDFTYEKNVQKSSGQSILYADVPDGAANYSAESFECSGRICRRCDAQLCGAVTIAAVSLASQYTNVLFMVYYGLGTGVTMLSAQYYGKKDLRAVQTVEGIAMRFSIGISVVFASLVLFAPEWMMRLFTNDAELISIGASYLRPLSICYLCWGVTEI